MYGALWIVPGPFFGRPKPTRPAEAIEHPWGETALPKTNIDPDNGPLEDGFSSTSQCSEVVEEAPGALAEAGDLDAAAGVGGLEDDLRDFFFLEDAP